MRLCYPVRMYKCIFILALLVIFFPFGHHARAQVSDSSMFLEVNPAFPEEGETYTISANTYNTATPRSSIHWFVNGIQVTEASNQTSITLTADQTPDQVTARITLTTGQILEETFIASPYRVDLIIDAETLTPAFYNGRNLPSSGSTITATALVFNNDKDITDNFSYLWKVNNKTQNGGSLYGQNTLDFKPSFEYKMNVSVDIFNSEGTRVAGETVIVPIVEPELYFYEQNPLRGLLGTALRDPHIFVGEEMVVRAEGYYMDTDTADIHTMWEINNKEVAFSENPTEITLRKEGNAGTASLSFHIRNMKQLLQGVEKSINIQF